MTDCLLMIFVKNPTLGKVKTRLAASVGDEKALEIYQFLLKYTQTITSGGSAHKIVFYTDFIDQEDNFGNDEFEKKLQVQDPDLGMRMYKAFEYAFEQGYKRVVIIGSDCYELSGQVLQAAFGALQDNQFVIGPANDGGYYLLGMNRLEEKIFKNKNWSTVKVFEDTVKDFEELDAVYQILPMLTDIDYLEDMPIDLQKRFKLSKIVE